MRFWTSRSFQYSTRPAVPLILELLEDRRLFSAAPIAPLAAHASAPSAIVARPAASTSIDGTYTGEVILTLFGKNKVGDDAKIKIEKNGTLLTGILEISETFKFKIAIPCTFVRSSNGVFVFQQSNFFGEVLVQIKGTKITVTGEITVPRFDDVKFDFTGNRTSTASAALKMPAAQPQAVAPSPMIGNYTGALATAGVPHISYTATASIKQAKGANLKLVTGLKIPTFGTLVGTFVITPSTSNKFTYNLGKSQAGQAQTLSGKLDKHRNLQLTFFVPPQAALTGTLTRI